MAYKWLVHVLSAALATCIVAGGFWGFLWAMKVPLEWGSVTALLFGHYLTRGYPKKHDE